MADDARAQNPKPCIRCHTARAGYHGDNRDGNYTMYVSASRVAGQIYGDVDESLAKCSSAKQMTIFKVENVQKIEQP